MAQSTPIQSVQPIKISLPALARATLPVALLVAIFGQPNGLFLYVPSFSMLALLVLSLFTLLLFASKLYGTTLRWPNTNLSQPVIPYLLLSFCSLVYAPNPVLGIRLLVSVFFKVVLFYAIVDLCSRADVLRRVMKLIVVCSLLFTIQGLSQMVAISVFRIPPSPMFNSQTRVGDTNASFDVLSYGILGLSKQVLAVGVVLLPRCQAMFLEPGFFANYLEMALFVTLAYFSIYPPKRRWLPVVVIGLQFLALILTFSPLGVIAVGLGLLVYICFTFRWRARLYLRRARLALLTLLLCLGIARFQFPDLTDTLYKVIVVTKFVSDQNASTSSGERVKGLSNSVELFMERPILGWGTNQTRIVANNNIANNALLTAATELGVVGLVIYIAMLGCVAITMINDYWLARRYPSLKHQKFSAACAGGATALIFHSMFIDTQWTFYYWIGMAMLYVSHRALVEWAKGRDVLLLPGFTPEFRN